MFVNKWMGLKPGGGFNVGFYGMLIANNHSPPEVPKQLTMLRISLRKAYWEVSSLSSLLGVVLFQDDGTGCIPECWNKGNAMSNEIISGFNFVIAKAFLMR